MPSAGNRVRQVVGGCAVAHVHVGDHALLGEGLQGPVHRRTVHAGVPLFECCPQLLSTGMTIHTRQRLNNGSPGTSDAMASAAQLIKSLRNRSRFVLWAVRDSSELCGHLASVATVQHVTPP